MKKLLLIFSFIFLITANCWAAINTWEGDDATNPTYWNVAANWSLAAVPVAGDDVVIANALNCFVNAHTAALKSLDMTGYTGTLSGTYNITIRGLTAATNVCKIVAIGTWTGTLIFSPASTTAVINFTSNASALTKMTVTSGAAVSLVVLQDNLSFTAVKTNSITLTTQGLDLNGFTISGNSGINRLLIQSITLGTAVSLTTSVAGSTFANCDFRDITFINGANLDLSAITGGSGDCGGNTVTGYTLTLTTATDWFWDTAGAGTYDMENYLYWFTATNGGGTQMASTRVPLPQDNCYFDASSVTGATTVDQNMPRICKTLDFTGVGAMNFHMDNVVQTLYGGLIFVANVAITGNMNIYYEGRGSFILDPQGKLGSGTYYHYMQMIGGTLTLASDFVWAYNRSFLILNGTFNASTYNCAGGSFNSSGNGVRALNMGSGIWTVGGSYQNNSWNIDVTTNLTFNKETANIVMAGPTGSATNFLGGGLTYNNITVNTAALRTTFTGSNTFGIFTINAPKTVRFTSGTTQTVNKFIAIGSPNKQITLSSATARSKAYLKCKGADIQVRNCNIKDIWITNPNPMWKSYTQDGNIDQGGNKGWLFYLFGNWSKFSTGVVTTTNKFFLLF